MGKTPEQPPTSPPKRDDRGVDVDAQLSVQAQAARQGENKSAEETAILEDGQKLFERYDEPGPLGGLIRRRGWREIGDGTYVKEEKRKTSTGSEFRWSVRIVVVVVVGLGLAAATVVFLLKHGRTSPEDKIVNPVEVATQPIAAWNLASFNDSDRLSEDTPWPFKDRRTIRFVISNVPEPELSSIRLKVKETQLFPASESRSDTFGNGATVEVDGPSRGGNAQGRQDFYLSPVSLPGGIDGFLRRFPAARVEAFAGR